MGAIHLGSPPTELTRVVGEARRKVIALKLLALSALVTGFVLGGALFWLFLS